MKKLLISLIAVAAISTPALAGDVTITVPDSFKVTMQQTSIALERCLGAVVMGGDKSTCQGVQNILTQLANLPETPVAAPATPSVAPSVTPPTPPVAASAPTPAPEAQKKTEGDAGK